jgi:hypothetical protein
MLLAFYRRHVEECADDLIELYGKDARDLAGERAQDLHQDRLTRRFHQAVQRSIERKLNPAATLNRLSGP